MASASKPRCSGKDALVVGRDNHAGCLGHAFRDAPDALQHWRSGDGVKRLSRKARRGVARGDDDGCGHRHARYSARKERDLPATMRSASGSGKSFMIATICLLAPAGNNDGAAPHDAVITGFGHLLRRGPPRLAEP